MSPGPAAARLRKSKMAAGRRACRASGEPMIRTAVVMFMLIAAPALAQGRGSAPQTGGVDATPHVETAGAAEEKISQTTHTMRLDGRDIKYTATAGTLPIRLDNGQVAARMVFVAYTKKPPPRAGPLRFGPNKGRAGGGFFSAPNTKGGGAAKPGRVSSLKTGAPGGATIWLQGASSAPRGGERPAEVSHPAPPYRLV